jgi:FolB domain-containing protein
MKTIPIRDSRGYDGDNGDTAAVTDYGLDDLLVASAAGTEGAGATAAAAMKTLDRIRIHDLSFRCIIGVNDEERTKRQDVVVNLTLFADLASAAASDRLEDTVDYKTIKHRIVEEGEASHFHLLEGLAGRIGRICLEDRRVKVAKVTVEKPSALRFARSVSVEMCFGRDE